MLLLLFLYTKNEWGSIKSAKLWNLLLTDGCAKTIIKHLTRKTTLTKFKEAGQLGHKIIQVTRHARETLLNYYDKQLKVNEGSYLTLQVGNAAPLLSLSAPVQVSTALNQKKSSPLILGQATCFLSWHHDILSQWLQKIFNKHRVFNTLCITPNVSFVRSSNEIELPKK